MRLNLPVPLEASEQALEEMFRHTPVGVVVTDLHGLIVDANHAFCAMLGREREEIVGQQFVTFVHPEEREQVAENLGRLRQGELENVRRTRRFIAADDRVITTRITASLVHSKDREPICGIAFIEDIGEHLALDNALRESEQRYRRIVEDQTELIVRCLPDGTRLFVNDAYCRYNEESREELLGTSFFPRVVEEERDAIRRKFASLTPENPVLTDTHRIIDPRGAVRWHEWTDRGFFDDGGTLVEIQSVGRDITETRHAQELSRQSDERFRLLYESLPIAVWETDFRGVLRELRRRGIDTPAAVIELVDRDPALFFEISAEARPVRANRAALTMAAVDDPVAFFQWLRLRYTFESARAYVRAAAVLILGEDTVVDIELPLRAPDGRRIDLLQRLAKAPGWPDDARLIAIGIDVTERKETERDLAHRRKILEEAELLAHVGSWEWDPAGDQLYGSAGFWRILDGGSAPRFASVAEAAACFHEEDRQVVVDRLESLRRTGMEPPGSDRDMRVVHPDGSIRVGRGAAFAERNTAGQICRIYGVIQDLTEQRRAEQAAQREREAMTRADKMISLGILVSGVAHEISNPNHAILLNTPLLRQAWASVSPIVDAQEQLDAGLRIAGLPWREMRGEAASMIDDVEHAAERVRAIVTELHGFARSHDSGEHRLLALNDVVQSSLRLIGNHIRKATNEFSVALMRDLPTVRGNAQRLEQVVINLVLNSCQALQSRDALISIETGRIDSRLFIRVTDGGRGIREEDLSMIKDPFFTTKRAEGGTGLGLAVSERIVQEHGGELTFESAPGRGTVATLFIPEPGA